jgi:hypothetical protein
MTRASHLSTRLFLDARSLAMSSEKKRKGDLLHPIFSIVEGSWEEMSNQTSEMHHFISIGDGRHLYGGRYDA